MINIDANFLLWLCHLVVLK